MPGIDEILREQPRTATDFQHETTARPNRFEQFQNSRRDRVSMKAEALMMNTGQIRTVVRRSRHPAILASPGGSPSGAAQITCSGTATPQHTRFTSPEHTFPAFGDTSLCRDVLDYRSQYDARAGNLSAVNPQSIADVVR